MTSYSRILIEFIRPLLDGRESEADFLQKAQTGVMAWNHVVSDEHQLPLESELKSIYSLMALTNPESMAKMNMLIIRKLMYFNRYHQFIIKVESRKRSAGTRILYVESMEAEKFRELLMD